MTLDHAVALSLLENLPRIQSHRAAQERPEPRRTGRSAARAGRARARARPSEAAIRVVAWNDAGFPDRSCHADGSAASAVVPGAARRSRNRPRSRSWDRAPPRRSRSKRRRGFQPTSPPRESRSSAGSLAASIRPPIEPRFGRAAPLPCSGSGLDRVYPAEHHPLAQEIARTGLVVSEFPPGAPPLPHHFPMRNRLISGLSLGVVVIEASEKSGSLITASCALEQGREVMVVPGNVLSGRNKGGHALLRDGAKIVETADDIVRELGWPMAADRSARSAISGCRRSGFWRSPDTRDVPGPALRRGRVDVALRARTESSSASVARSRTSRFCTPGRGRSFLAVVLNVLVSSARRPEQAR